MADEQEKVNTETPLYVSAVAEEQMNPQPMTAHVDNYDEPINQSDAERAYLASDSGIPIRHPMTREYYTLYGPRALDVLRRRKRQGFVVVGVDPLADETPVTSNPDTTQTESATPVVTNEGETPNVAMSSVAGDGDGTAEQTDTVTVSPANTDSQVVNTAADKLNPHTVTRRVPRTT